VIGSIGNLRDGNHVGAYAGFATKEGEAVTVRIGVSLISVEQTRRNLAQEMPQADFDGIAERAKLAWDRQLGKIDVEGGTEAQRRTFYTALYHTVQFPHMLQETDSAGMTARSTRARCSLITASGTPSGPNFRC
jgi:putative alpha-1,2-mannosidase